MKPCPFENHMTLAELWRKANTHVVVYTTHSEGAVLRDAFARVSVQWAGDIRRASEDDPRLECITLWEVSYRPTTMLALLELLNELTVAKRVAEKLKG